MIFNEDALKHRLSRQGWRLAEFSDRFINVMNEIESPFTIVDLEWLEDTTGYKLCYIRKRQVMLRRDAICNSLSAI